MFFFLFATYPPSPPSKKWKQNFWEMSEETFKTRKEEREKKLNFEQVFKSFFDGGGSYVLCSHTPPPLPQNLKLVFLHSRVQRYNGSFVEGKREKGGERWRRVIWLQKSHQKNADSLIFQLWLKNLGRETKTLSCGEILVGWRAEMADCLTICLQTCSTNFKREFSTH